MMIRKVGIALLVLCLALGLAPRLVAAGDDPATAAGRLRSAMLSAQAERETNPNGAAQAMAEARKIYTDSLAGALMQAAPVMHDLVLAGLDAADQAIQGGGSAALADARAQVWTGLLGGSYEVVQSALRSGDGAGARTWLRLREFRPPTRFSRPSADATVAIERFLGGELAVDEALLSLNADLLDTYQERLRTALQDLAEAEAKGFATRVAEHGSLAYGYFTILAPSFEQQQGQGRRREVEAAFSALRSAARGGGPVTAELSRVSGLLKGFRAAPLSPAEQARRAGQLRRFLGLVPVEYERGVSGGKVTKDFEIYEAITFRDGAEAAFADLRNLLEARDSQKTEEAARRFSDLGRHLEEAVSGKAVASPGAVQGLVREIDQLMADVMDPAWLKRSNEGDFDVVAQILDQMEQAVGAGQYDLAESARLEAYAVLETGPEPRLVAFAPQFIPRIENLFWFGSKGEEGLARLIEQRATLAEIKQTRDRLSSELGAAQQALAGGTSPAAVATNAGVIVFREGLEAVLILASLMAGFQRPELQRLRRPLWWGAGVSLLATVLTWALARGVLVSLARFGEKLEAIVSVIAVAVLLLITNWFFHKSYWTDWLASFHTRKKGLVGGEVGQWIGLATLGFTSIYREGFETVLFLQALVLDAGNGPVLGGVAVGMAGVALVGVMLFALQVRLPYKKMLIVTGIFIGSVLLTMVGKMVHSFQVIGWIGTHPIRSLELPYWSGTWFGLFSTWEGIILQLASATFVIGSYYVAEWLQRREASSKRSMPA